MDDYGKELIIDLHNCDSAQFTRKIIKNYFKKVCKLLNMERCKLYWWDDLYTPEKEKETEPHLIGISAIQFIKTSNITIHTLDILQKVYLNIFSCKNFDENIIIQFSKGWFKGEIVNTKILRRL